MNAIKSFFAIALLVTITASAPVQSGYKVGDTAMDFKLKNYDGRMVSMADYKDAKGYIVIFNCNTCPYSKAYDSRIIALNKKYASKGFPVLTINPNDPDLSPGDSFDEMKKQAKRNKYDFPYLVDETQDVARAYGATNTPHVYVLDKVSNEKLKVVYIGAIDDNSRNAETVTKKYVEDAIGALMQSKNVPVTQTKAIGCTIKWRNS
ncbi:MAG TPA: thioredoxin family protein [Cyclobacteriaceae bacterium]|nr:thioredoxin family protein [Cyclobacteriaceae bacterium]